MVKVCPITGIEKEEKIKHFRAEEEEYAQEETFRFSTYAAQTYPDVCGGNCETCDKWEERTEKELYIRDNDTFTNHVIYEGGYFLENFLYSLPFTLLISGIFYGEIRMGIAMSFAVAMGFKLLDFLGDFYPTSFEKQLEEKFEKKKEKGT